MKTFLYAVGALIALLVVAAATIYFTGNAVKVIALFGPGHGWDLHLKAPAPDYADERNWAALPTKPGLTAYVPAGVAGPAKDPQIDVFFIHPTGYMNGAEWNSPLDANSQTEENTRWMMANQANAFNGCCAIYAPRYREASIFRYISAPPDIYKKAGDFAYDDVDRAFTYFLEHYSKGRPFIIASHSQGTEHGFNLIRRRIDGTPLASRLVAAYLIGGGITDEEIAALRTVHACASPTDIHCVIHWATYGEGASPVRTDIKGKLLCINPLTWARDGGMAVASLHKGAVGAFPDQILGKRRRPWRAIPSASGAGPGVDDGRMPQRLPVREGSERQPVFQGRCRRQELSRTRLSAVRDGHPRKRDRARPCLFEWNRRYPA